MNEKISKILADLYMIEPELKKHENEIIKIVEEYLETKPDTKFDEKFALELKEMVLKKITEMKPTPAVRSSWADVFILNKFAYALSALAVVLAIILPVVTFINKNGVNTIATGNLVRLEQGIKPVGKNAFGKIAFSGGSSAPAMDNAAGTAKMESGAVSQSAPVPSRAMGMGGGGGISTDMKIMPPLEYPTFQYIYKGEEFKQELASVDVYKKVKGDFGNSNFANFITSLNYDLIDMSKLNAGNLVFTSLSMDEDKEYGHTISIDMRANTISMWANWNKWPHPDTGCKDENCYQQNRLKIEDIPADDKIIETADSFLAEYGVDKTKYGLPVIQNYWRTEYERATNKSVVYIPDEMTVVYPLLINGLETYDESGYPYGLYVAVNVRYNRGAGINPITPQNFESSAYEAETDAAKILDLVKQGGLYPEYRNPEAKQVVDVELGAPKMVLMHYYQYKDNGESDELFVPALLFKVEKLSDDKVNFYKQAVILPLAKDFIANIQPPMYAQPVDIGGGAAAEPMPLIERK